MKSHIISGLSTQELTSHVDSRGKFTRLFDTDWFGLNFQEIKQINYSFNPKILTLRGMHFQVQGEPEQKIITLLNGSIFIGIIDLRADSLTYLNTHTEILDMTRPKSILVPSGCATGWLTLAENSSIHYAMTSRFEDNRYSGYRFDDPRFGILWPARPLLVSEQDLSWPLFGSD